MSVIQVQASTAKYRIPALNDAATAEFDDIAATARGSLAEMRRMLGVLRTEDQTAELAPQQGIDDIPALVDTIRRAGVEVGLVLEGGEAAAAATPSVQIAAFRIVQEALSNAVRHAPGARIAVQLRAEARSIRIRVHNGRTAPHARRPRRGLRPARDARTRRDPGRQPFGRPLIRWRLGRGAVLPLDADGSDAGAAASLDKETP